MWVCCFFWCRNKNSLQWLQTEKFLRKWFTLSNNIFLFSSAGENEEPRVSIFTRWKTSHWNNFCNSKLDLNTQPSHLPAYCLCLHFLILSSTLPVLCDGRCWSLFLRSVLTDDSTNCYYCLVFLRTRFFIVSSLIMKWIWFKIHCWYIKGETNIHLSVSNMSQFQKIINKYL